MTPHDRREDERGRERQPEASTAPGEREHAEAERDGDGASRRVRDAEIRQQRERGVRLVLERLADVPQEPRVVDEAGEGEDEQQGRRRDGRCDGGRRAPADQCQPDDDGPEEQLHGHGVAERGTGDRPPGRGSAT